MTLIETIRAIESAAVRQPSVKTIVQNDVFRLNTLADAKYGVFAWTQGRHRSNLDDDYTRYSFVLYYVDRLRNDQANQIEVQSVGVETLTNILRLLRSWGLDPETYEFQTFNQRFADECAGVYCSVIFAVQDGFVCPEDYYADGEAISASDASLWTSDGVALAPYDGIPYKLRQTASQVQAALDDVLAPKVTTEIPDDGMLPGILYVLGTLTGSVAFSLKDDGGTGNHWYWTFDTGAAAPTVSWPSQITRWAKGSAPEIAANTHYEVSVLDGVAAYMEV